MNDIIQIYTYFSFIKVIKKLNVDHCKSSLSLKPNRKTEKLDKYVPNNFGKMKSSFSKEIFRTNVDHNVHHQKQD